MASKTRRVLEAVALVAVFVLGACERDGRASDGSEVHFDTLAGGGIHVSNPELGVWGGNPAWSLTENLRIGSSEAEGPESFGSLHDLEVDAYGRIYVLDRLARHVAVFDSDGDLLRTLGGQGAGPGELADPSGFAWMPDWQLWVEDQGNARFAVFDTTGALLGMHSREFDWSGFRWAGGFDSEGNGYGLGSILAGGGSENVLLRLDPTGVPIDTFPLPKFTAPSFEIVVHGRPAAVAAVPFSPGLRWQLDQTGALWFGTTDEYRFTLRGLQGDTVRIVERRATPIPITASERDAALDVDYLESYRDAGVVDPGKVPLYRPLWHGFTVDPEAYLWAIPELGDDAAVAFDVFDPEGVYLGRIPFDVPTIQTFPAPVLRGGHLYAVVRGHLGIQYVVRALVDGRPIPGPM